MSRRMSLGRYIDLSRNPVEKIKTFVEAAKEKQQNNIELMQLSHVSEGDFSFVLITDAVGALQQSGSTSTPNRHPLPLSAVQTQYLKDKPAAVGNILRKLKNNGFNCKFDFEARQVEIKPTASQNPVDALQIIKDSVVEIDLPAEQMAMMDDTAGFLPTQDADELQALIVKVGNNVKVVGMASDITRVGGSLGNSLKSFEARALVPSGAEKTEVMPLTEHCFNYLYRFKMAELKGIVTKFTGVSLEEGRNNFKLHGPASAVDEAALALQKEIDEVKTYPVKLGAQMNVAVVSKVAEEIAKKYECSLTFQQNFGAMGGAPFSSPILEDPNFPSLSLSVLELKDTRIRVLMNALEKQKAHVIVNTTNSSLELGQGQGVSSCIAQAAGPTIQEELKSKYPKGIKNGEVAVSGPGEIKTCKTIYHGSLPQFPKDEKSPDYKTGEDNCFKWMVSLVFNCLIKASSSKEGYRTIAFPALGTGTLQYPALHVVQLMYKAIKLFNEDKRSGQIKDIILVIYPDTKLEVKQMFLAHRQTYKMNTRHVASDTAIHEENQKEEGRRECEIRTAVGKILLQVVNGKIQDSCEVSEAVLVLWTEETISDPTSNPGLVCLDRLKKDWKCSSYVSELDEVGITTDTTTLPRRTLIHVYCKDNSDQTITEAILQAMQEAAKFKCLTLTIPIAAEGQLARKPRKTAGLIIKALKRSKAELYVVTVAIEDNGVFENFAKKVATTQPLQEPADIDKSPVAVDQWKKTFAERANESHSSLQAVMTMTNQNSVLLITSDSDMKNEMAGNEIQQKLTAKLSAVVQQKTM